MVCTFHIYRIGIEFVKFARENIVLFKQVGLLGFKGHYLSSVLYVLHHIVFVKKDDYYEEGNCYKEVFMPEYPYFKLFYTVVHIEKKL